MQKKKSIHKNQSIASWFDFSASILFCRNLAGGFSGLPEDSVSCCLPMQARFYAFLDSFQRYYVHESA